MGARRFGALLEHLPDDGAYKSSLGDPTLAGWGLDDQLLGMLVEQIDMLRQITIAVNSKKAPTLKPLQVVPRPKPKPRPVLAVLTELDKALAVIA